MSHSGSQPHSHWRSRSRSVSSSPWPWRSRWHPGSPSRSPLAAAVLLAAAALIVAAGVCVPALANSPGDFSGDGVVDDVDLGLLIAGWTSAHQPSGSLIPVFDLNSDGVLNHSDVAAFLGYYLHDEFNPLAGATTPPGVWPAVGPVTFTYRGQPETWSAYPGQVIVLFNGAPAEADATALITGKGGTVLAKMPAFGLYLVGAPAGSEGAFITAVSADSRVYMAVPHIAAVYSARSIVRTLQVPSSLPAGVTVIDGCADQHGTDVKAVFTNNGVPVAACLDDSNGAGGRASALTLWDTVDAAQANKTGTLLINISSDVGLTNGVQWENVDAATQRHLLDEYEAERELLLKKIADLPASWRANLVIVFCAGNNHVPLDTVFADLRKDPAIADVLAKNVLTVGSLGQSFSNYASASDPDFVWTSNPESAKGTSFAAPYALGLVYKLMKEKGMTAADALAFAKTTAAANSKHELSATDLLPPPPPPPGSPTYSGSFTGDSTDTANGSIWADHVVATVTLTVAGDGTTASPYDVSMTFVGTNTETLQYCDDPGGCYPGDVFDLNTSGQNTSTGKIECTVSQAIGTGGYSVYLTGGTISSDGMTLTATVRFSAPGGLDTDITKTVKLAKQQSG